MFNFQGSDPELCLSLFNNTQNFIGLKKRIKTADQKWIEEFLERGGLDSVLHSLSRLSNKRIYTFTDAIKQLECISCIKGIMNHPFGMEYVVMTGGKSINKITEGNVSVTIDIVYSIYGVSQLMYRAKCIAANDHVITKS